MKLVVLLCFLSVVWCNESMTFYLDGSSSVSPDDNCSVEAPCVDLTQVYAAISTQGNPESTIIVSGGIYQSDTPADAVMHFEPEDQDGRDITFIPSSLGVTCMDATRSISFNNVIFKGCEMGVTLSSATSFVNITSTQFVDCSISIQTMNVSSVTIVKSNITEMKVSVTSEIYISDTEVEGTSTITINGDLVNGQILHSDFNSLSLIRNDMSEQLFFFKEGTFHSANILEIHGGSYSFEETHFDNVLTVGDHVDYLSFEDCIFTEKVFSPDSIYDSDTSVVFLGGMFKNGSGIQLYGLTSLAINETEFSGASVEAIEVKTITLSGLSMDSSSSFLDGTFGSISESHFNDQKMVITGVQWSIEEIHVSGNLNGPSFHLSSTTTVIEDSSFDNSMDGALFVEGSDVTINGCNFTNNFAQSGAAILGLDLISFTAEDCIFNSNFATYQGGAIQFNVTDVRLDDESSEEEPETEGEETHGEEPATENPDENPTQDDDPAGETKMIMKQGNRRNINGVKKVLSTEPEEPEGEEPGIDSHGLSQSEPEYTASFYEVEFNNNTAYNGAAISCCSPDAQKYCVVVAFDHGHLETGGNVNTVGGDDSRDIYCIEEKLVGGEDEEEEEEEDWDPLTDWLLWTMVGLNVLLIVVLLLAGVIVFYYNRQKANYQLVA